MSDNNSTSRTALVVVLILIGTAVAWIFWPSNPESSVPAPDEQIVVPAKVQTTEQDTQVELQTEQELEKEPEAKKSVSDFRVDEEDYATIHKGSLITTNEIEDLIPGEEMRIFKTGQKVYVYAEIRAPRQEKVRFTWYDKANEEILPSAYVNVEMNIGDVGFRVYSYRTFRATGEYRVTLFNSTGAEIGSTAFTVQ